jgi:hypothetical protein
MVKRIIAVLFSAALIVSCGGDNKEEAKENGKKTNQNGNETNIEVEKKQLPYDTLLNDYALFIAGLPTQVNMKEAQAAEYYKEHQIFTDTSWKFTTAKMLNPIKKWAEENKITNENDTGLCFYPLSGPDFLFGNAFFPNSKQFVLLGLEPKGSLCDFRSLKEPQLKKYLSGIRESMKYLNKAGYFVTSHMSGDFTRAELNGMVHMMLYMMARTGHKIVSVSHFYIDADGTEKGLGTVTKGPTDETQTGVKIEFLSPDGTVKKSAYYLRLNARDDNMQKHMEFEKFVNNFGNRVAYMKSASCVLTNTDFSVMRNLVLNSSKILQDDTGVPYKYFDAAKYDITLFGTYTTVIDDLSWCFQPGLEKALKASSHFGDLPFRISYNGNYGEGMLMYAVKK